MKGITDKRYRGGEDGAVLVIVILILVAITGIVMGVSSISVNETQLASNEKLDKKVFYLTEGGVEKTLKYLAGLSVPFKGSGVNRDQPVQLFNEQPIYGIGKVTSYIDPLDSNSGETTRFVGVTVRGTLDGSGITKVLRVKVGQQNFSRYSYFSDMEKSPGGTTIWWYDHDELHGPVHTNDQLHIHGNPTFYDEVASAASSVDYYHGGPPQDNPDFREGLTLDASVIPLPANTDMLYNAANESGGLQLNGNPVHIEFDFDGSNNRIVRVTVSGTTTDMNYPSNGVIYVNGNAEVEGMVRGQVTVGCSGTIRVTDNLVYETDPRTDPTSNDYTGLVAEQNVLVAYNSANWDSGDETIMAAIMALNTSWEAENYSSGSPRGKLIVYGGIIQAQRGPVGTFNSYGIVSGYEKDYSFGERLLDNPPPAFPTTGQVEKVSWTELDPSTDITANFW